jgi:hypothetical protein
MTDTLSEFSADAVEAFRAESAGDVVMPPGPATTGCR